ncbi:uncharacterized protein F4822DRAFT_444228 [Hypoxylon trugodes]|uniref:uncharacterized protein n=1 Tax=Hypoxylon trugodes TaxID=326681 RepID=UPI002193CE8C|nr:uncharacterized protein F4822DRAFT_444228 [Hypoxylon trugodes]KAI1387606.1 hypothetical protein F4822DRAFT_444228 [Hypoxylon trugodes]
MTALHNRFLVPLYQPETAFEIFAQIIRRFSVSTGADVDLSSYNASGPVSATKTFDLPKSPENTCWIRDAPGSCSNEQIRALRDGEGSVVNGVLQIGSSGTKSPPTAASDVATTTTPLIGLFTATGTSSSVAIPNQGSSIDLCFMIGTIGAAV